MSSAMNTNKEADEAVATDAKFRTFNKSSIRIENRIRRFGRRRLFKFSTLGWLIIDSMIGYCAVLAGYSFSPFNENLDKIEFAVKFWPAVCSYSLILISLAYVAGLEDSRNRSSYSNLLAKSILVGLGAVLVLSSGWALFMYLQIGRYVLLIAFATTVVLLVLTRHIERSVNSTFQQKICFLGSKEFYRQVDTLVEENLLSIRAYEISEDGFDLERWALTADIDEVVYDPRTVVSVNGLVACLEAGIRVTSFSNFIEEKCHLVPVDAIDPDWLFSSHLDIAHPIFLTLKRLLDIGIAIAGLILSFPILLMAMITIKISSPGPMFYSQVRVGRFNRLFRIHKLRTMRIDSEKDGALWAENEDPRITKVGKFFRKTRIDEIPQLINILKGDMSLIGPRPERPEFVEMLSEEVPFYSHRHLIKPGLTGWAQINFKYGASVEDSCRKLMYDMYYLKNASILLDLQIAIRTIGAVMKGSQ